MSAVFRPIRTAISVGLLGFGLWAAFAIDLGDKTFAEHVDTISETPEAKQLIDDTRSTINPALVEVRDRVLGEYVEAPTWIPDDDPTLAATHPEAKPSATARSSERAADSARPAGSEPPLPGRRSKPAKAKPPAPEPEAEAEADPDAELEPIYEPRLPGRR